ncbi:MAG: peptidyl-prolyl cis-trans isomerase, partial [Deltaproteobacteria bacterium]|nr:peptidyl-prolyl cis-trans isomerase [Deltaproteobacteria bacterium]
MKKKIKISISKFLLLIASLIVASLTILPFSITANETIKDLVIVSSKDFKITVEDFDSIIKAQSPSRQKEIIEHENQSSKFLEKLINMNLLAAEAKKRGLENNPELLAMKKNRLAALLHSEIEDNISSSTPTDEEISEYYSKNNELFNKPEKIRARIILISDKSKALELLDTFLKSNISQYDFKKNAVLKSEDKLTSDRGGNIGFFTKDGSTNNSPETNESIDKNIAEAAFKIPQNGKIFPHLVQTEDGFNIIMRTGHRDASTTTLESSKMNIERIILKEKKKDEIDSAIKILEKKYKVTLYEENLKHVVIDLSGEQFNQNPRRKILRKS